MHLTEEAERKRGRGQKWSHSWVLGIHRNKSSCPLWGNSERGKVLKTWQSGTQLTHSHPEGQAIVSWIQRRGYVYFWMSQFRWSSVAVLRTVNVVFFYFTKARTEQESNQNTRQRQGNHPFPSRSPLASCFLSTKGHQSSERASVWFEEDVWLGYGFY